MPTPRSWVNQIFQNNNGTERTTVRNGGVLRRSKDSVHQMRALDELKRQVKQRGFHMFENAHQYVILCTPQLTLMNL